MANTKRSQGKSRGGRTRSTARREMDFAVLRVVFASSVLSRIVPSLPCKSQEGGKGSKEFRMAAVNLNATRAEMPTVIALKDIIEALEFAGDEVSHYLDPDTGEITMVTDEERDLVEEDDEESLEDLPDWQ